MLALAFRVERLPMPARIWFPLPICQPRMRLRRRALECRALLMIVRQLPLRMIAVTQVLMVHLPILLTTPATRGVLEVAIVLAIAEMVAGAMNTGAAES